jgi:type IV secretion system protein VirD4
VSEQRRALLLPQEVKELGTEEAIVFYEGLRPIRCRKIRYFADARFRQRLVPPPSAAVPKGNPRPFPATEPPAGAEADPIPRQSAAPQETASGGAQAVQEEFVIRDGTPSDIDREESLTVEDFAADISTAIPQTDRAVPDAEMEAVAKEFLATLKKQPEARNGR